MDIYLPAVVVSLVESYFDATYLFYYKHNDLDLVKCRYLEFDFCFIQSLHEQRTMDTHIYVCYCIFHDIRSEVDKYWDMITCNYYMLNIIITRKASYLYERVMKWGRLNPDFICLLTHDQIKTYFLDKYHLTWQTAALNNNRLDILSVTGMSDYFFQCDWERVDVNTLDFLYSRCQNNLQRDVIVKNVFRFSMHFHWARAKSASFDAWNVRYSLEYLKWAPKDFPINPQKIFRMTLEEAQEFKTIRGFDFDFAELEDIELSGDIERVVFLVTNCRLKPNQYIITDEFRWDYDTILDVTTDPKHILHQHLIHRFLHISTSQNAVQWLMTHYIPYLIPGGYNDHKRISIHRRRDMLNLLKPYPEWKHIFSHFFL